MAVKNCVIKCSAFVAVIVAQQVLLSGCGNKEQVHEGARTVHVNLADTTYVEFDPQLLIPLETNDSSMLYNIYDIVSADGKLIVWSRNYLRVFDRATGRYLYDLATIGQGPGEYVDVSQMWAKGDTINLLDFNLKAVLSYLPDGTFVRRADAPQPVISGSLMSPTYMVCAPDGNGYYVLNVYTGGTTETNPKFSFADADMHFVENIAGKERTSGDTSPDAMVTDYEGDRVLAWDQLRDTLFMVRRDGVSPLYIFDYGKNSVPEEISSLKWHGERSTKFKKYRGDNPYASYNKYYQPYNGMLYFSFATSDENVYLAEYDEAADKITTFSIHDPEGRYKQSNFFKVDGDTLLVSMDDDDPDTNPMLYRLPISSIPR